MAVKIRLKRLGKIRVPQYRIVVVDSRKKRDGRVIEEIGKYHPKEDPSYIDVVVRPGAVLAGRRRAADRGRREDPQDHRRLAEVQGPAGHRGHPEGQAEPKRDKLEIFNEALKDAASEPKAEAVTRGPQEGRRRRPRRPPSRPRPRSRLPRPPPPRLPPRRPPPRPPEAPAEDAPAPVPADETPEGAADAAETAETAEADADAKTES